MSEITLEIGRRRYALTCEDGQEEHVRALATQIDTRLRRLGGNLSQSDTKNMLFAALMLADELHEERQKSAAPPQPAADTAARMAELEEQLGEAEDEAERLRQHLANANKRLKELDARQAEPEMEKDRLAKQLEGLAETLEKSASLLEGARTTH